MDKTQFKNLKRAYNLIVKSGKKANIETAFNSLIEFMAKEFNTLRQAYKDEWLTTSDMQNLLDGELSYKVLPNYLFAHGCLERKTEGTRVYYRFNGNLPANKVDIYKAYDEVAARDRGYNTKSHKISKKDSSITAAIALLKEVGYKVYQPQINEEDKKALDFLKAKGYEIPEAKIEYVEL